MSERHCPLCNAKDIYLSNIIPTESIACIYKRSIGVDIDDDIKGIPVVRRYICKACGLIFFSPAIVGSDIFYSKLQEYEWYYMKDKVEFSIAADNIKMGDTVLEVGCGQGFFQKKIPGRRYIGLEASASAIDRAEEGDGQIFKETVESHVGWNSVRFRNAAKLFVGLGDVADFYFVHSYVFHPENGAQISGLCDYGGTFCAALEQDNIHAAQFHPEKSHRAGLAVLKNFLTL